MNSSHVSWLLVSIFVALALAEVENKGILKRGWGKKLGMAGKAVRQMAGRGISSKNGKKFGSLAAVGGLGLLAGRGLHIGGDGDQSDILNLASMQQNGVDSFDNRQRSYDLRGIMDILRHNRNNYDTKDRSDYYEEPIKRSSGECGHRSKMTASEAAKSLSLHNTLRGQEGASNMAKLTYNQELADRAQQLSDTCVWDHGLLETCDGEGLGQNMYIASGSSGFPDLDLDKAITGWYNEKHDYNYYSDYCTPGKMCGHYTQLAWAKSTEMGCGVSHCPVVKMSTAVWRNALFFVCDYGPSGNWQGEKPFDMGPPCSDCAWTPGYGNKCDGGLCAKCTVGRDAGCRCQFNSQCSGNGNFDSNSCSCRCDRGFYGDECENSCACEDEPGYEQACPQWAVNCSDPLYKNFLLQYCKQTCNFCTSPPGAC